MEVCEKIRQWAEARGIYANGDVLTQFLKLTEEAGELSAAVLKSNIAGQRDALGDCAAVVVNLMYLINKTKLRDVDLVDYKQNYFDNPKTALIALYGKLGNFAWFTWQAIKSDADAIFICRTIIKLLSEIATVLGFDLLECTNEAYDEIKQRTGKMENGNFIKDLV